LAGFVGVQKVPATSMVKLETSNDNMETEETYTEMFQEEGEITKPKIKNKRDVVTNNLIVLPNKRNFDTKDKLAAASAKHKTQVVEATTTMNKPQITTKILKRKETHIYNLKKKNNLQYNQNKRDEENIQVITIASRDEVDDRNYVGKNVMSRPSTTTPTAPDVTTGATMALQTKIRNKTSKEKISNEGNKHHEEKTFETI